MPTNHTPIIPAFVAGDPVQINVKVLSGPGGNVPNNTLPLVILGGDTLPGVGSLALHPTDTRAVVFTPANAGAGGSGSFVLSTTPSANNALSVDVAVTVAPNVISVEFDSFGPVEE